LLQLNNYSTTMAFIAGFNKSSILRLKLTFKELSQRASKVNKILNNNLTSRFYTIMLRLKNLSLFLIFTNLETNII